MGLVCCLIEMLMQRGRERVSEVGIRLDKCSKHGIGMRSEETSIATKRSTSESVGVMQSIICVAIENYVLGLLHA